jgi:hypothetical protein
MPVSSARFRITIDPSMKLGENAPSRALASEKLKSMSVAEL